MSLNYDPQGVPTLKNLCLEIESGWKVGVVGSYTYIILYNKHGILDHT